MKCRNACMCCPRKKRGQRVHHEVALALGAPIALLAVLLLLAFV
jgi:hypothetical protein